MSIQTLNQMIVDQNDDDYQTIWKSLRVTVEWNKIDLQPRMGLSTE